MTTVAAYLLVNRFFVSEIQQRAAIQKWLTEHNVKPSSVQWFVDREDKTELKQLSRDIENGSIKTLLIYSLEQAFNSIPSITAAITDFALKDMEFASVSQGISFDQDSIDSAASLLTIVLTLSETYHRMRQAEGIEIARAKGLYKGKAPGSTKPGVDIKKAVRWKARGWSGKRIAKKLGVAESTVWRFLRIQREK